MVNKRETENDTILETSEQLISNLSIITLTGQSFIFKCISHHGWRKF